MAKKIAKMQSTAATTSEEIDRQMVFRAREKQQRGETPTRDERTALRRFEKIEEERLRWIYYATIPKKHWRQMSGRQNQVLSDQAERYGIPLDGSTIDLAAVAAWLHDFLAANSHALNASMARADELERVRRAQAEKYELENLVRKRELRHVDDVRRTFEFVGQVFRKASMELRQAFGDAAYRILESAVEDAREIVRKFQGEGTRDGKDK
jgi:hypothetical protein